MMRMMLYEAAQSMLVRAAKWSWLKAWAMKIARHRGMKKAIVALARRLAVIMHRIWLTVLTSGGPGRSPRRDNCTVSNQIGGNLRSTQRWSDVPRGTMDEVSSYVRLNLPLPRRQGRAKDCSTSSSNPMMEGP